MSSELETKLLGELVTHKKGFAFKSSDYQDKGVAVIRVTNFSGDSISSSELKFVSREVAEANSAVSLKEHDIVVATVGSWPTNPSSVVGRTISVPYWASGSLMNQNSVIIRATSAEFFDQKFIYYQMKSSTFANHVISKAQGSANQASITLDTIFSYPIWWPEDQAARKNATEIFFEIDCKLTLLRETNSTLEAIAQALFKSWFVDFDPVRAKQQGREPEGMDADTAALFPDSFKESELDLVPKGWQVLPVGDVVESVGGGTPDTKETSYWDSGEYCWTTPKDLSGIQAPVLITTERKLTAKGLAKVSSGLLPAGTLLMSSRAPIGYLAIAQVPMAINQGYIAMLPNSQLPPLYMLFWCQWNMEIIRGRANGSTFMEISKKAFRPISMLVPPTPVVNAFIGIAGDLFERLVENVKQAQTLATLRDTLLPRLISGQLRLPEAEAIFDEAAA